MATTKKTKVSKNAKAKIKKTSLDTEQIKKAREIASTIDHTNQESILNFGLENQKNLNRYSSDLLDRVQVKDAGDVGEEINSLMRELNMMDVDSMGENKQPFLSRLPVIGKLFNTVETAISRFDSVAENIEGISHQLDKSRQALMRDSVTLNNLFDKNVSYIKEMEITIQAGYIKIQEIVDEILPAKEAELKKDPENTILIQEINDLNTYVDSLDKKVHDLDLTKMIAEQALPQIRMIQSNSNNLVEKIQSSVMNTIPLWKMQITTALTLNRQKKILDASQKVTETTNKLLQGNATMLKVNTIKVAEQNEESVVSVETIKMTNKMLIETIDEISKIREEGKRGREKAKIELQASEKELTDKILNHKNHITTDQKRVGDKIVEFEQSVGDGEEPVINIPSMVDSEETVTETK